MIWLIKGEKMRNQKSEKVLIIHNNDFPELETVCSEEPPSQEDNYLSGISARAGVKIVAHHIQNTLKNAGFPDVQIYPVTKLEEIHAITKSPHHGIIFNLCESLDSDPNMEIEIIKILENGTCKFTGNKTKPLANCLDKFRCSFNNISVGVTVPDCFYIKEESDLDTIANPFETHNKYIVKPNAEDGSTGIDFSSVVTSKEELHTKVCELLKSTKSGVIIQEYIEGREINLSVLDISKSLFGFTEIDFSNLNTEKPRILNYASKWCADTDEFHTTPSIITSLQNKYKKKILESAKRACEVLEINSYARLDYRVSEQGVPYIIDVNPNCDLDPTSGFSKAFGFRNISYEKIITNIVKKAHTPQKAPVSESPSPFLFPSMASTNLNYEYTTN